MKSILIWLFVAVFALTFASGCDRSSDAEEAPPAQPDPEAMAKEMAEAMGKALVEGMAKAMGEDMGELEAAQKEMEKSLGELTSLVDKARALAKLRKEIKADPEAIDELLGKAGITEDELEELLFEIAKDPVASAAYAEAK